MVHCVPLKKKKNLENSKQTVQNKKFISIDAELISVKILIAISYPIQNQNGG